MKTDLLQHELAQTSAIFGRKHDVRVRFRANSAMTDGATIILPSLGFDLDVDDETAAVLRGFVDHEAGHVRHTDFAALRRLKEKCARIGDALTPRVHNALEDIWLERRVIAEYPGAARNLLATTTRVNQRFLDKVTRGEVPDAAFSEPKALAAVAITWQGRLAYGGPTQRACLGLLKSAWLVERLPKWIKAIDRCRSTGDTAALAFRITVEIEGERAERLRAHEEEKRRREEERARRDAEEGSTAGEPEAGGKRDGESSEDPPYEEPARPLEDAAGGDGEGDADKDAIKPEELTSASTESAGGADGSGAGEEGPEPEEPSTAGTGACQDSVQKAGTDDDPEGSVFSGDGPAADGEGGGSDAEDQEERTSGREAEGGHADKPGAGLEFGPGASEASPDNSPSDEEAPLPPRPADVEPVDGPSMADVLRDAVKAAGLLRGYRPFSTAEDKWHHRETLDHPRLSTKLRSRTAADYDAVCGRMTGEVNVMRRTLERLLLARERRDWSYAKDAGQLDARRFPAAVTGRANVFKARGDRAGLDTAVTILVDLSGSMEEEGKRFAARDCVIALAEAIDRTSVAYEILGWNNCGLVSGVRDVPRDELSAFGRLETLDMWVFKAFAERLSAAKGAIAALPECVEGNNTDGEAVWQAYLRLRQRPEKRKVMFVLSDGAPLAACAGGRDVFEDHLRSALARVEGDGQVACVGLGIMTDAVKRFYRHWAVVRDVEHLAGEGLGLLAKVLLGGVSRRVA